MLLSFLDLPAAWLCHGVCVEVDSDTEAVLGKGFKLTCISCKMRGETQASATVDWWFMAKDESEFTQVSRKRVIRDIKSLTLCGQEAQMVSAWCVTKMSFFIVLYKTIPKQLHAHINLVNEIGGLFQNILSRYLEGDATMYGQLYAFFMTAGPPPLYST